MKTHDELMKMSHSELLQYLSTESEKLIESASPHNQLKLRALQAQCDGIRRKVKAPTFSARLICDLMLQRAEVLVKMGLKL